MDSLRVLNLEGNPVAQSTDFPLSQYVITLLPNLHYYEYTFIKSEMREKAQIRFR